MKNHSKVNNYFKDYIPALILSMKGYNPKKLSKDIISGIIVGIIALPLSLALAIASGAPPEIGLITAVIGGGFAAFLSGSRIQVSGPTAAFIPIVLSIAASCGPSGFLLAIFLAGVLLLAMGFFKLGKLINYISLPIIAGFTTGIAISIFTGQLGDLFGYDYSLIPKEFIEKIEFYITNIGSINITAMLMGIGCIVVMVVVSKFSKKIPSALVAILLAVAVKLIFDPNVETIGSRFGELQFKLKMGGIDFGNIVKVIGPAISIALLAAIESLLSAKAADNMTKTIHNPNTELISQGAANIASSLFGGLPVTGAIARTSANIKNGGTTPISTITHAVTLLLIGIFLMPFAVYIPLCSLAAVLIMVCKNMINIKEAKKIFSATPKDMLLFVIAMSLTVIFDLVVAILTGMAVALGLVIINYVKSKIEKKNYKLELVETEMKGRTIIEINGALNFITDTRFKLNYDLLKDFIVFDMNKTFDLDLQGYMVIVNAIKRLTEDGKTVKVIGNKRCIKYLFKINFRDEESIDLTNILVEQSMLEFNENN